MANDLVESRRTGCDRLTHLLHDRIERYALSPVILLLAALPLERRAVTRLARRGGPRGGSVLDDRGTCGEQALAPGAAGPRRHGAAEAASRSHRRQRARVQLGLDDDHQIRERGDQPVALRERPALRLGAV